MKRFLERADGVAVLMMASLTLASLVYEHLTTGFVDYGLLFLCIISLYIIYLVAFLLALPLSGFFRRVSQRNKKMLR
ncbi:MAG: hypothetical protein OEY99_00065 [Aigarchaeota archaeon]|nr:hypothetical protein [Aigarchaeota archaeon]MDH5702595.1 hypothetical protein [Aigarchaeota archaeon]